MARSFHQYSPRSQVAACAAVSALALFVAWHVLIEPERMALALRRASLDRLTAERQRLAETADQLPRLQRRVAKLEEDVRTVTASLLTEHDAQDVLRTLHDLAADASLELGRVVQKPFAGGDGYAEWPVDLELRGGFHQLSAFVAGLAAGSRLVAVSHLHLRPNPRQEPGRPAPVLLSCTASSFVLAPITPEGQP